MLIKAMFFFVPFPNDEYLKYFLTYPLSSRAINKIIICDRGYIGQVGSSAEVI